MKRFILMFFTLMFFVSTGFSACTADKGVGNVLRLAMRAKFKSMDPAHGGDYYSNIQINRSYEGLLRYNYLKRPYVLEPALARAMPAVSADGKTFTFKIQKGVYFQDDDCFVSKGRELTARDFVYSFERVRDPKEASEGRWIFDGKVKTIKAVDSHTLVIELLKKNDVFLHTLTMPFTTVVAKEAVEKYGKDFAQHPVGTGPFRLERMTGNQMVWVKNPGFRRELASAGLEGQGLPLPFVDKVVDDIIVEDMPAWLNFKQGNHDVLLKIPKDNVFAVWDSDHKPGKELRDRQIKVVTTPGVDFTYIAFNMDDPALGGDKNRFLRQAMSLAYNDASVIEKFHLGLASKAEFLIPPSVPGFDPKYYNTARKFDVAKAKALLAKAGHAGGVGLPELSYDAISDTANRQSAEYFQRLMADIGVKINLNFSTWPELLSRIRKKKVQIYGNNWLYDYPDAENGLQLLYSGNESPGPNGANYKNPKYDKLFLQARTMSDGLERRKLIAKMREIFEVDVPWIFGVHRMETRLVQSWVKNFTVHAFEYGVEKYILLDVETRAKALR